VLLCQLATCPADWCSIRPSVACRTARYLPVGSTVPIAVWGRAWGRTAGVQCILPSSLEGCAVRRNSILSSDLGAAWQMGEWLDVGIGNSVVLNPFAQKK
jgi:hypothetical protein